MAQSRTLFIGMDVHKDSIAVAYVSQDHGAEVPYLGSVGPRHADIDKLIRTMQAKVTHLLFVYEAGPCGSWLSRSLPKFRKVEKLSHAIFPFCCVVGFGRTLQTVVLYPVPGLLLVGIDVCTAKHDACIGTQQSICYRKLTFTHSREGFRKCETTLSKQMDTNTCRRVLIAMETSDLY